MMNGPNGNGNGKGRIDLAFVLQLVTTIAIGILAFIGQRIYSTTQQTNDEQIRAQERITVLSRDMARLETRLDRVEEHIK